MARAVNDMSGKTVIVTGANSGIGFETAAALAGAGARVVITARDPEKGKKAVAELERRSPEGSVELAVFDLSSLASVREGVAGLRDRLERVHVLVNNAGLMLSSRRQTADGLEMTFATNHLGPFVLTLGLIDRIEGRIVNVSSTAHKAARGGLEFDDLQSKRRYRPMDVYAKSKLANIYFTTELARRLDPAKVTANALHPGTVRSGFAGDDDAKGLFAIGVRIARPFMLTPARGAETSVYLASSPEVEGVTGRYFVKSKPASTSKVAQDPEAARRLWEESERLAGVSSPI